MRILIVLLLLSACAVEGQERAIGAVLPLTGPASLIGESQREGIDLALEELKSEGIALTIVYEDSRSDPKTGIAAFQRLIDHHDVPAVFSSLSGVSSAILPIADEREVNLLLLAVSLPNITQRSEWAFRFHIPSDDEAEAMSQFLEGAGKPQVSLIYILDEFGVGAREAFKAQYAGSILSEHAYEPSQADFRAILSQVKAEQPQAIYVIGYTSAVPELLKQKLELGIEAPAYLNLAMTVPSYREAAGAAAEGAVYTATLFDPSSSDPRVRRFVESYRGKFGHNPNFFAAFAYDATNILARALEQGTSVQEIREGLRESTHTGVMGEVQVSLDGSVRYPLRIVQFHNGTILPLDTS